MDKGVIILFMIFFYSTQVLFVYYMYNCNNSVSNIICNNNCKYFFLFFTLLMGIGAVLYEYERNDLYSQILIFIILIGLHGLIYIDETHTIHYVFACLVFIGILIFMIRHCYLKECDIILSSSLFLEIIMLLYTVIYFDKNIFYSEAVSILNFAFFYFYLHIITDFDLSQKLIPDLTIPDLTVSLPIIE